MWFKISLIIIKYRALLLTITAALTIYFGYQGTKVQMTYDFIKVLPDSDSSMKFYQKFRQTFGEEESVLAIGVKGRQVFEVENFNAFIDLNNELKKITGVKGLVSIPTSYYLKKDTNFKKFDKEVIFQGKPKSQNELDSLLMVVKSWEYNQNIYNSKEQATIILLNLDNNILSSSDRKSLISQIEAPCNMYSEKTDIKVHYGGLPFIRTVMSEEVKGELNFFIFLSVAVTCLIMLLFFRSLYPVVFTFLVIAILIAFTLGSITLLGYKITLLTGILPALIIIISIPNCIYMYNKYHREIKAHGNKTKAVSRIISKIGFLTLMTNANTAVGFFVLMTTDINVIREFGIVAGIVSVVTFIITLIVIPTILYYLPHPKPKALSHLDLRYLKKLNQFMENMALKKKKTVFAATIILLAISFYGITKLESRVFITDDLPAKSRIKEDLAFFENNFSGVLPLEIVVEFDRPNALTSSANMKKLQQFEQVIAQEKNISDPLSILSLIKTGRQAFYDGNPEFYALPEQRELLFLKPYLANNETDGLAKSFVDSTNSKIRITSRMADIGTEKMAILINNLETKANEIFKGSAEVNVTGASYLFLKGNQFLVNDLSNSLVLAFILISLMLALIYFDPRIIIISLIPNIVPMIITAGIMGYFGIPLKPSTALIFSISFGISIDSTIHFISKFKQELKHHRGNIQWSVLQSLEDSGTSIIYTSLVLFGGFFIFCFSDFGGTIALGLLTSITLILALIANLLLLPALILQFYKNDGSKIHFRVFRKRKSKEKYLKKSA